MFSTSPSTLNLFPSPAAIRGSALATLAVIARGTGMQLVPQLPLVTSTILAAADKARARLSRDAVAAAAVSGAASVVAEAASDVSDEEGAAAADRKVQGASSSMSEEAAAELAGALAALSALLEGAQGPFLSPYTSAILKLALAPEVSPEPVDWCVI